MLQYVQYNPESTGPIVIAIPALGERKEIFEALAKNLKNFRFFAVDLPGHNSCSSEDFSIENYVKDLKKLSNHLAIPKAHFIGNSIGAWIIQSYFKLYPQTVHSLTLLDGGYYFIGDYEEIGDEEIELPVVERFEDLQTAINQQVEAMDKLTYFSKKLFKSYFLGNFSQKDGAHYSHHSNATALNALSKATEKINYCLQQNKELPVLLLLADQKTDALEEEKISNFLLSNEDATVERIPDSYHLLPITNSNGIAVPIERFVMSISK